MDIARKSLVLNHADNALSPAVHTVLAQSAKPEYEFDGDDTDYLYIAGRGISIAHPEYASIILPSDPSNQQFIQFCNETLHRNRRDIQALLLEGDEYLLDQRIINGYDQQTRDHIESLLSEGEEVVVYPYTVNEPMMDWYSDYASRTSVYGESPEVSMAFGHKGIMHRHIAHPERASVLEDAKKDGVRIPRGYVTSSLDELKDAYDMMFELTGRNSYQIKGVYGSAGTVNTAIYSRHELNSVEDFFLEGDVSIEERLPLEHDEEGNEINCSVQYANGKIFGRPTIQIIEGTQSKGNIVGSPKYAEMQADALDQAKKTLAVLRQKGFTASGSFDFVFAKNKTWLIDVNCARDTAAHVPKHFAEMYAGNSNFVSHEMPNQMDVFEAWERVKELGFDFSQTSGQGVYPLYHLQGVKARWIATDPRVETAMETLRKVQELIA